MKNETGLKGRNSADLPSFQTLKIVKILVFGLHKWDIYGHSGEVGDIFKIQIWHRNKTFVQYR